MSLIRAGKSSAELSMARTPQLTLRLAGTTGKISTSRHDLRSIWSRSRSRARRYRQRGTRPEHLYEKDSETITDGRLPCRAHLCDRLGCVSADVSAQHHHYFCRRHGL